MTTRRVSGGRRPEALKVGDDVVDLRWGERPLEGCHEGAGLALLDRQPELLARAAVPEGGVAEVPRLGLDGGRRRPVAAAPDAVAGCTARLVDPLPPRDVRAATRPGPRRAPPAVVSRAGRTGSPRGCPPGRAPWDRS